RQRRGTMPRSALVPGLALCSPVGLDDEARPQGTRDHLESGGGAAVGAVEGHDLCGLFGLGVDRLLSLLVPTLAALQVSVPVHDALLSSSPRSREGWDEGTVGRSISRGHRQEASRRSGLVTPCAPPTPPRSRRSCARSSSRG